ncbi:MAG: ABC transporter permease [Lentisphaerae bacterium]|jgi:ribose/xylose/arabinose/galactoside ABC-type transport system permease subunit|nr:ABC transporter permease [Lentisphaerota bacterium]
MNNSQSLNFIIGITALLVCVASTFISGRSQKFRHLRWPLVALSLLFLYNLIFKPTFFALEITDDGYLYGSLIDILNHSSKIALLATGMTLVIATGGVDISVGSIMAISGAVAATVIVSPYSSLILAVFLALLVSTLAGLWNGILVAACGIQPMVATLVLMVAGRGIAQLITDGTIITFHHPAFNAIGNGHLLGLPVPAWLAATIFLIALALTRTTSLGLFIETVGNNRTAARYAGIAARKIVWITYVFSGFCAGIAGLVVCSNIKCADANHAGLYLELDAILATVIGGTSMTGGRFYLSGSILGAILIQALSTVMYANDVNPAVIAVPKAILVIAVCLLQSDRFRSRIMALPVFRKFGGEPC